MKTDFSKLPREEIEARITTMLLGEMPADEAADLREYISHDAELQKLHDDLKQTISLVTEATANEQPMQLASGRREELLESFKMVRPPELARKAERESTWRTWAALAAMIVFLLVVSGVMLLPSLAKSKSKGKSIAYASGDEESEGLKLTLPGGGRGRVAIQGARESEAKLMAGAALERAKQDSDKVAELIPKNGESFETRGLLSESASRSSAAEPSVRAQPAKIELPVVAESDSSVRGAGDPDWIGVLERQKAASPEFLENPSRNFQAGQSRGYAGFGGARFDNQSDGAARGLGVADAEGKSQATVAHQNERPGTNRFIGSFAFTANPMNRPAEGNDFFAPNGAIDAKKDGAAVESIAGAKVDRAMGNRSSADDPLAGLPVDPTATSITAAIDPLTGLPASAPAAERAEEVSQMAGMGGMGGGANMSMMYYMSNPELMKRYFPQMYSMMQKQKGAAAGEGANSSAGVAGLPGLAGASTLADSDANSLARNSDDKPAQAPPMAMTGLGLQGGTAPQFYNRYRIDATPSPVAPKPAPVQSQSEQKVALGTELNLATAETKAAQINEIGDLAAEAVRRAPEAIKLRREQENQVNAGNRPAELETLKNLRASIDQRILQEKRAASAPSVGGVAIVDKAEPEAPASHSVFGDTPILGRFIRGKEERVARLEVTKPPQDVTALTPNQQSASYDPYFIQSESEKIRSQKVLGEVIDELKLDQKWSEQEGRRLSRTEALERLKKSVTVDNTRNGLLEIRARGEKGADAAKIANKVAEVYQKDSLNQKRPGIEALGKQLADMDQRIAQKEAEVAKLRNEPPKENLTDIAVPKAKMPAATPQPEISTAENAFSTFSLNVSDVSFKLAAASLEKGLMPEAATVRSEEFINAFDYRDAEPQGAPIGFVWERARYPFAQDRDLLRFSVKTAASGRQAGKPLNLVILLDSSGSMERADRVRILNECLKTLAAQLRPEDRISVVAFARTARLWVDGLPGNQANELPQRVGALNPEGGTNLEEAMKVAYETARKHFTAEGVNRVVLLTDGAANLGDVEPESLKRKVETERKKGIALDCFGIGWEGLNDELLEALSRNGDGRYGFVNTPEAAASEFAGQLAGALQVAASDVKVQVEWNPKRVTAYRQIGYAKHQLTKEQFRDNTVDAAEIGAAEAGNALYTVQVNAAGEGPLGTVRVRFKVPGTSDYREHAWPLNYEGASKALENSSYPLRLAGSASAFSEWLVSSPYATEVTTDRLLSILSGVPEHFGPDPRPKKLEWMIRQAKSLAGK